MMSNLTTIGLDIAKSVFQVHDVDAAGKVAARRKLKRGCVGILQKIALGHNVRLLPT